MSVTTELREVMVREPVVVYRCDGPACDKAHERVPTTVTVALSTWITVSSDDRPTQHYCSLDCLADAVVP